MGGETTVFLFHLRHAVVPDKLLVPVPEIEDLSVGTCSGQCVYIICLGDLNQVVAPF